ncbi:MAG: S8 family serine peptidase [Anaerolineae bacterium]|jgi:uncharacterized repeat protein (TIGR01451 family)|nr:S8 family serine peptidase [Anaerolineae bacterium]
MKRLLFLSLIAACALGMAASMDPPEAEAGSAPNHRAQGPITAVEALLQGLEPEVLAKLEPGLLKQMVAGEPGGQIRAIVVMSRQADLGSLPADRGRAARRSAVVALLRSTAHQSQAGLLDWLRTRQAEEQVTRWQSFWVFNGLAVTANAEGLLALAARPEVETIREDAWRQWIPPEELIDEAALGPEASDPTWNISRVGADQAWSALGLDGKGTTVAIMDTGVDWQHPSLQEQYRGYKAGGLTVHQGNWYCTTEEGYLYPVDGNGHGTHVAGTAVGLPDTEGRPIGVAPGARWIAVKMLSNNGYGYDSWIHEAFEWIMAPAGDPNLAPDVINGSWGASNGANEILRPDLQAVRAAGIMAVFSAGNDGPYSESIQSPASFPEVLAVGASDDLDKPTTFSGRGPSPWDEIKPEVVAPGVMIRSSLPGGTYGSYNGTSMAAPHVTGLVALLLQADPALTIAQIEGIITSTAETGSAQVPNNDSGWGRIDAFQAAATSARAGYVEGRVLRQTDSTPVSGSTVAALDETGVQRVTVGTNASGQFWMALPAGTYRLHVAAFGYAPSTTAALVVQAGVTSAMDIFVEPLPTGVLRGYVRDAESGGPVAASVLAAGTPAGTFSAKETGAYTLSLPAGSYAVEVKQNGYRRYVGGPVEIVAGVDSRLDVDLQPAPTLLLMDTGGWYYGSQVRFFKQALDDNDYVYDEWQVRELPADVPAAEDLAPYQIIIWSSPKDSPGLVGAGGALRAYLQAGGKLILTGQDVGFWDSSLTVLGYSKYYRELLKVQALEDNAGREDVLGLGSDLLAGLTLALNDPDSAQNQVLPDSIGLLDERYTAIIAQYADGANAASRTQSCQSYRAVYLAAGLEGLGDPAARAAVVSRAINWLDEPDPTVGVELYPPQQESVVLDGQAITYTLELKNLGRNPDRLHLSLTPTPWSVSVWDSTFTSQLTQSQVLSACMTQTLGIRLSPPAESGWNLTGAVTLTARSGVDPAQSDQATFRAKTPAPILLVDDHRWYDSLDAYTTALDASSLPYDVWRYEGTPLPTSGGPTLLRLQNYPIVVWFTGYDWFATLTELDEARLEDYLQGGGRLLLSSQDYFETRGPSPFNKTYLGVASAQQELTATLVLGAVDSPVGAAMPAVQLVYPYENWSDALRATDQAQPAFWGQHGQPVALNLAQGPWKTTYFAFSLEALPAADMARVLGRAVGWLSPLGDSSLEVDRRTAGQGQELAYTLHVRNTGPALLTSVSLSNTLPLSTSYVAGSLEGPASYDPAGRRVTWQGSLAPGQDVVIRYRVQLHSPLPEGAVIHNRAWLADESGLWLERGASSRVEAPDLSASTLAVEPAKGLPGQVLTFSFALRNDGVRVAQARLVAPFPPGAAYRPGSALASSGTISEAANALVWSGSIQPGGSAAVTLPLAALPEAVTRYLPLRSSLEDGAGGVETLEAYAWIKAIMFMPVMFEEN